MKKAYIYTLILMITAMFFIPSEALADAGPKPSITVKAVNMPDSVCYMDLLVEDRYTEDDERFMDGDVYDRDMVSVLKSYNEGGWHSVTTYRDGLVFGDIICEVKDGECTMIYGYMVPDRFKIIVVGQDGETVVSNTVERKLFDSTVKFDYETGQAVEKAILPSVAGQFAVTLPLTLVLEGLVLLMFGFSLRKNKIVFPVVNIFTQILLLIAVTIGMLTMGLFGAIFVYIISEIVIFIIEGVLFGLLLKEHSVIRRVLFSITANIVSFAAGLILLIIMI